MNKRKILWIEDDQDFSNKMMQFFGRKYEIVFAQNNEKALDILNKEKANFDLLVADLHLGSEVEGGVFIQNLQMLYPALPIVVVTNGNVSEVVDAIKAGAKDVLAKAEINAENWVVVFDKYATPKIFLSYSSADTNTVKQIKQLLSEYGISIWFDRNEIPGGDSISTIINKKLEEANIILMYFSEHSTSSEWMENELKNIQKQQLNDGKRIIPIVSDVEHLPKWLKDTFYIEVPDKKIDNSAFVEKLVYAITNVKIKHQSTATLQKQAEDESRPITERIELWNKVFDRLGDTEASAEEKSVVTDKIIALKNQEGREANLKHNALLKRFSVADFLFFGKVDWTLHPRVNILLSENGMGKTTLLRLLAMVLSHDREIIQAEFKNTGRIAEIHLAAQCGDNLVATTYKSGVLDGSLRTVPCFAVSDMRHLSKGEASVEEAETMGVKLVSGANKHFMKKELDTDRFVNMLHLLVDEYRRSATDKTFVDIPVFQLITHILQELLGETFKFANVPKNSISHLEVITPNDEKPVALTQLSRGTNSVLYLFLSIWMHLRAVRDAKTELGTDTTTTEPHEIASIVIIDEIDAHLHPKWQRKIVDLLLDSFPNVQFIMASHSPLVVAGKTEGVVVSLKRSNQGVSLVPYRGDLIGETPNDIMEEVFSVSDLHEDKLYLKYGFLSNKKDSIQAEVEKLEDRDTLSEEEEEALDDYYADLRKIEKYESVRDKIRIVNNSLFEIEKLESKVISLEREIEELKSK